MKYNLAITYIISSLISIQIAAQLPLGSEHNHTSAQFIQKEFKSNNQFDLNKIQSFLIRLEKEKAALVSDMYETKIIEKIELEIDNHKDAVKSAKKELDEKKSKYIIAFDQFLIPQINKLYKCVELQQTNCTSIAESFITGYSAFYLPRAPRRITHQDLDYISIAKSMFGYSFSKQSQKIEAANLMVENENLNLTQKCIPQLKLGDILTPSQISKLKNCQIDLSIYNPSSQDLWKKHDAKTYQEAKNLHLDWFPTENEKVTFKNIKFSSAGSPKLEAEFSRNKKDIDLKVKMGFETHTEIITSNLGKLIGFYQDTSISKKLIKIYFPDDVTYENFRARWSRRYKNLNRDISTYVDSYGQDSQGRWVKLKDVQLSINNPDLLRIGPYDPTGWDLPNLREHRAQVLWFGLMNLYDTKPGNHLLFYEKSKNGYNPRYSFQDVGYSLHFQFQVDFSRLGEMLNAVQAWGVNNYNESFLKFNDDKVHIAWGDVMLNRARFQSTTYNDLKWMARKIVTLSHEDIKFAVQSGGLPSEISDLYIQKITNRRNEIVKAFNLENEFNLYPTVNLNTYSPNKKVKNGKLTVSHFDGYASYELPRTTVLSLILQAISGSKPMKALNNQFKMRTGAKTEVAFDGKIGDDINIKNMNFVPGVHVELNRSVEYNNQFVVKDGKTQAFTIKDKFAVEININSSLFSKLKDIMPGGLSVNGNIKAWKREFELIHFADTLIQAYQIPFSLFSFIPNWKDQVVDGLERGEILKISDSYGVEFSGRASGTIIGVPVAAGASIFWQNSKPTFFAKDQWNQLFIYHVENQTYGHSLSLGLDMDLSLMIFSLPILEFSKSTTYFNHKSGLYRFVLDNQSETPSALDLSRRQNDLDLLNRYLDYGDQDPLVLSKKEISLTSEGQQTAKQLSFLLFWNRTKTTGLARSVVKTSNNETRKFLMYTGEKSKQTGADRSILVIDREATLLSKDNLKITIEVDQNEADKMVSSIEIWNYDRKMNRQELVDYITDINNLFSKNVSEPFYKDYYLPPADEVNKYRKVYSHNRLFIYGDQLIQNLAKMSDNEVTALYGKFYKGNTKCKDNDIKIYCQYNQDLKALKRSLAELKKQTVRNEDYLKSYYKLLSALRIDKNGTSLIQELSGEKNMFLMGELYGVYPSFSTMQQFESVAGRRFAGRSWGTYQIPPLRQFLHNHILKNESIYVNGDINFNTLFGTMPTGLVQYY